MTIFMRMAEVGARCFLVGESLMRQADVATGHEAAASPARDKVQSQAGSGALQRWRRAAVSDFHPLR